MSEQVDLNENGLSQRLVILLERRRKERPYFFMTENMEDDTKGNSPRVDIAARAKDGGRIVIGGVRFAGGARFLALEAKRLPAPAKDREREYLVGKRGGVERFKRARHGADLRTVGIVGYVQRHDFRYWIETINAWIDELIATSNPALPWDARDRLKVDLTTPRLAHLRSNTLRVSDRFRLEVRHVWVQLSSSTTATGRRDPAPRRHKDG